MAGELDLFTGPILRRRIGDEFAVNPDHLVLDLTGVAFLGCSGLAVLGDATRVAVHTGTTVRLVGSSTAVDRPLVSSGMAGLFPRHETVADALSAAAIGSR